MDNFMDKLQNPDMFNVQTNGIGGIDVLQLAVMQKYSLVMTGKGKSSVFREFWGIGFDDLDEYGFERPINFNYEEYDKFKMNYMLVLAIRSRKWAELERRENGLKKGRRLKRYIRKGIPLSSRGQVWLAISGAQDLKSKMSAGVYASLLEQEHNPALRNIIMLDLHRTYPDNVFFQGPSSYRNELYNILIAYAHHNPVVGYCQGLNYIAGMLLLATCSGETTFWLIKVLVENILQDYYSNSMEGVIVDIEVLSELIRMIVPDVYEHMSSLGLSWAVVTTKWFVCLYADVLPVETVLRIWDCLFSEGAKILFRVAITLIKRNRAELLACKDFTEAVRCFKDITQNNLALYCHDFMESIFHAPGKLSNSTIEKLRKKVNKNRLSKNKATEKKTRGV